MATHAKQPSDRERLNKLVADGNFKDAYEAYRRLALDPKTEPNLVPTDLKQAVLCLQKLGRIAEVDDFLESVVAVHHGKLAAAPGGGRELPVFDRHEDRSWPANSAGASGQRPVRPARTIATGSRASNS